MSAKSETPISGSTYNTSVGSISRSESVTVGDPKEEIASLFSWVPPHLEDGRVTFDEPPTISGPLPFYDKHIHPERILKRVVHAPTIQHTLCSIVDDALNFFEENGIDFPPVKGENSSFESTADRKTAETFYNHSGSCAEDVRQHYCTSIGAKCIPVASGLVLASRFPFWFHLLLLHATGEVSPHYVKGSSIEDLRVSLDLAFLLPDTGPVTTSSEARKILRTQIAGTAIEAALSRANRRFQQLITFKFLPPFPESDALLRDISELFAEDPFKWESGKTSGYTNGHVSTAPFSTDSPENPFFPSGRSTPIPGPAPEKAAIKDTKAKIAKDPVASISPALPKLQGTSTRRNQRSQISNIVQRAWAESVDKDTTIIMFRSALFERIAIRERKTQQLYLSDLYAIKENEELPYIKVHTGLFIAAVKDTIRRAEVLDSLEEARTKISPKLKPTSSHKKHKISFVRVIVKRHKVSTEPRVTRSRGKELRDFKNIGRRNVLLVTLSYGNYSSPTPTSLFRTGKALKDYDGPDPDPLPTQAYKCADTNYIVVNLQASVGQGATGMVHPGLLSAKLLDRSSSEHRVIIKLAFNNAQRTRLQNEYEVYRRLTEAGIDGVLHVWGLFENDAEYVSALVLDHGGTSLRRLKSQGKMIHPEDSDAFYEILAEINAAGVTHGDLRPENLLVDERGRPAIIDFDLAVMSDDKSPAPPEAGRLRTMLKVYYNEENG